jgi:hypothetical protein
MQTAVATINRAKDDAFFAGFFGNMLTGASQAGLVNVPFPAGNVIANDVGGVAGTPCGLNVAKVRAAAKLLGQQFNDADEARFMVVTADDKDQLLQEALFINIDFGAKGNELQNGKLRKLMGFEFIEMESENPLFWNAACSTPAAASARRRSGRKAAWPAIPGGTPRPRSTLPQKHHSKQVYASICVGCTRTDSGKVGYVLDKRN